MADLLRRSFASCERPAPRCCWRLPVWTRPSSRLTRDSLDVLDAVQRRVLWLATSIVHHANRVRSTPSGVKVGGHQASSASMVSIMSALYFEHLRAPDRVSVKPHAAPVLHAINYLLGRLDRAYLTELRAFGGLQSYPSRAQGPRPGRLLDGLGGDRRDRDDLERARAPLRRRPLRGAAGRTPRRAARRRRARRGRDLGGARRSRGPAPRRGAVDRRPQPPVAGPRRARHRRGPHRRDVRRRRLADDHGQVRAPAARAVRARRRARRCASASTRCPTRSTSGCCAAPPPSCASGCRATAPPRTTSGASSPTSTTPSSSRRSATSAATTSPTCATPSRARTPTTPGRRSSSPTRSRPGAWPPRATPPTTPRC